MKCLNNGGGVYTFFFKNILYINIIHLFHIFCLATSSSPRKNLKFRLCIDLYETYINKIAIDWSIVLKTIEPISVDHVRNLKHTYKQSKVFISLLIYFPDEKPENPPSNTALVD